MTVNPPSAKRTREQLTLDEATRRFQLAFVQQALDEHRRGNRWNISATAKALGVSRSFLYMRLEDLQRARKPHEP